MTRIQKERFASEEEYEQQKNVYVLDSEKLKLARENLVILHPLPKVDEISPEVDFDPRAKYFKQAEYGLYVRMALILTLIERKPDLPNPAVRGKFCCANPKCVTVKESYLPEIIRETNGIKICGYCEHFI